MIKGKLFCKYHAKLVDFNFFLVEQIAKLDRYKIFSPLKIHFRNEVVYHINKFQKVLVKYYGYTSEEAKNYVLDLMK